MKNVLVNADVRTMDARGTRAEALAWEEGRLLAVGALGDVRSAAGATAVTWDAHGATVLPGFIDAHHHPSIVALYGGLVRLAPPRVSDIASLQQALATAASDLAPGQWLVAMEWDEMLLAERRPPTRSELDDAVPDQPLLAFHYSCHRALANSRALELAGIDRHTPEPSGGRISRGANGVPDGLLIERGISRVEARARASLLARDAEGFLARLAAHHRAMAAVGITRVVDATVPSDVAVLYREAERRGLLLVPTIMMPVSTTGYLETPWDALEGPATKPGDGLLVDGPLKLVFDGAPGCAMCLGWWQTAGTMVRAWSMAFAQRSLDPLRGVLSTSPRVGRKLRTGIHIYERSEARAIVAAAIARGFALATHAIGNDAIDVALDAYEAAGSRLDTAGRPRIEHATFLSADLARRIHDVGAAVVAQPHFLSLPAFGSAPSVPGLRMTALRWLLDHGVTVAGSSDFPVAGFDPLDGVRAATLRRTSHGRVHEADQRTTLDEALTMYTRAAAEVSGCAATAGTLEAGKRADFVLLDGSLAGASALGRARVRTTILGGQTVFGALPAGDEPRQP